MERILTTRVNGRLYKIGRRMFCLQLPYPVSNNRYYRRSGHRMHLSEAGRAFKQEVQSTYFCKNPSKNLVAILVTYQPKVKKTGVPYKRVLDWDNVPKCCGDSLIGICYVDDKQIKWGAVRFDDPINKGGSQVEIFELVEI